VFEIIAGVDDDGQVFGGQDLSQTMRQPGAAHTTSQGDNL
jgi:hypothetical protein